MVALVAVAAGAWGCAGTGTALPTDTEITGRFKSFQEAHEAFLAIEPGKTTTDDLRKLKIDPNTQGTEIYSYQRAHPSLLPHRGVVAYDLYGPELTGCIQARHRCEIWRVDQTQTSRRRTTSILLDLLRFHRRRHTTGFDFDGFVAVLDGVAVFRIWGGIPNISEIDQSIRPLSFLQGDVAFQVPALGSRPVIFFEESVDFDAELEARNR